MLVDMSKRRTIETDWIVSPCGWTPFAGMRITGWPVATVVRRMILMEEDEQHETRALTYPEIAALFGVTVPWARNMASKRRWQRSISNDGKSVRVHVPIEVIPATPAVSPDETRDGSLRASLAILARHIETLQAELAVARADASQVPSLRASSGGRRGDSLSFGRNPRRRPEWECHPGTMCSARLALVVEPGRPTSEVG